MADVDDKALDEAREEGFQEGYSEGQNDANHASKDTFHLVIAWLRKRDFLQDADYPEGYTAEDIAEALNEHEENLVCLSKRAALPSDTQALRERVKVLEEALRSIARVRYGLDLHHEAQEQADYWSGLCAEYRQTARASLTEPSDEP